MGADTSHRFMFQESDVRGCIVQLDSSYRSVVAGHNYPPAIQQLLGEFCVASLLLNATIKYEGRLILQVRSDGPVRLLMVEASHDRKIRGIVRLAEDGDLISEDLEVLFPGGTMAVTIEPEVGERYQSLVRLTGTSLAACIEHYFEQSEQLNTLMRLVSGPSRAAGMLVQQMPPQRVTDAVARERQWEHLAVVGRTIADAELDSLEVALILRRLYGEEDILLLPSEPVEFACSCSEQRMARALVSLGAEELASLFEETPTVTLDCEFCRAHYSFGQAQLIELGGQDGS